MVMLGHQRTFLPLQCQAEGWVALVVALVAGSAEALVEQVLPWAHAWILMAPRLSWGAGQLLLQKCCRRFKHLSRTLRYQRSALA